MFPVPLTRTKTASIPWPSEVLEYCIQLAVLKLAGTNRIASGNGDSTPIPVDGAFRRIYRSLTLSKTAFA